MKDKSMSAVDVFTAMTAIVEQPNYPFLQSYKDDFYKHDRNTILNDLAVGSRYIWVINPSGTHLTRIGVHPKQDEWAQATIHCGMTATNLGAEIYLVTRFGVRKLNATEVAAEFGSPQYVVSGNVVRSAKGELLANFALRKSIKEGTGNRVSQVVYQSSCLQSLTKSDLMALRDIASSETVLAWSSFFAACESITVNGVSLVDLIESVEEKPDVASVCA